MSAHAGYTSVSRGVGILIKKTFPLIIQEMYVDERGRYAAITGVWEGEILNLISVYVPPRLHDQLFLDLGALLLQLPNGKLLLGGDFNTAMDETWDRWPTRGPPGSESPLMAFAQALGLADMWRLHNPGVRQYSYYSGAHGSLSRLDYLLTLANDVPLFRDVRLLPRGISDHSPVWAVLGARPVSSSPHIITHGI